MGSITVARAWIGTVIFVCGLVAALFGATPAAAQSVAVPLILQDFSDCQNGNVQDPGGSLTKGTAWVVRNGDGTTTVKVGITVQPDTTYHFYLKCVRPLGDIKTGDEGTGEAIFTFKTNETGNIFAFDSYPDGAPAGNKLQSMTVRMQ